MALMAKTALLNAVPTKDTMLQHVVQIWKRLREMDNIDIVDGDIEFADGKGPVVIDRTLGTKKRLKVDNNTITYEDKT
jgi:hypothetical protein